MLYRQIALLSESKLKFAAYLIGGIIINNHFTKETGLLSKITKILGHYLLFSERESATLLRFDIY